MEVLFPEVRCVPCARLELHLAARIHRHHRQTLRMDGLLSTARRDANEELARVEKIFKSQTRLTCLGAAFMASYIFVSVSKAALSQGALAERHRTRCKNGANQAILDLFMPPDDEIAAIQVAQQQQVSAQAASKHKFSSRCRETQRGSWCVSYAPSTHDLH